MPQLVVHVAFPYFWGILSSTTSSPVYMLGSGWVFVMAESLWCYFMVTSSPVYMFAFCWILGVLGSTLYTSRVHFYMWVSYVAVRINTICRVQGAQHPSPSPPLALAPIPRYRAVPSQFMILASAGSDQVGVRRQDEGQGELPRRRL